MSGHAIPIRLLFFGPLKEIFGSGPRPMEIPEGLSIDAVRLMLSHESEEVLMNQIPLVYAVNEQFRPGDTTLRAGDELAFMTPMSGG